MARSRADVTRLLRDWHGGDQDAFAKLMPLLYDELRGLAKRYMRRQSPGHMLQTTALLHEAYLKLVLWSMAESETQGRRAGDRSSMTFPVERRWQSGQRREGVGSEGLVVLALCLFAGCVPNRQIVYPTSGATGCSPNDIVLSDIATQSSGNNGVQETWNADCLRQHFRCTRSRGVTTCQEVTGDLAQPITRPPIKKDTKPTTLADLTAAISPLIQQIWDAYQRGDATAHNAQLSDDFTAVHPDGSVHSRKPTAQEIQAAPIGVHILSDIRVVPTGPETALANYLATVEVPGENAKLVRFYVGELWVKQAGQWKCRYYQATLRK